MTVGILVAAGVVILVIAVLVVRTRRPSGAPDIRRDTPTIEPDRPARRGLGTRLGDLFHRNLDAVFWDELEERLLAADVGIATTTRIVASVRDGDPASIDEARDLVRRELLACFPARDRRLQVEGEPATIVVVGVNGSGKTTTIAKLAASLQGSGRSVLVAAADTFRAAAAEQLVDWGERLGFEVVRGSDGADPASVAFDGRAAATARGHDVVIVDTAGRLHSKRNLMDELGKIVRVLSREGDVSEVLLVLDGSIGQNGIAQAEAFTDAIGVTGCAITKLDGSGKGGVAITIEHELGIPVKLIGVGERASDLLHFDPAAFVDELLGES